jgi:hypothetical protein
LAAVQDALNLVAAYPSEGEDTTYKQQLGEVIKPIIEASQQGLTPAANAVGNELTWVRHRLARDDNAPPPRNGRA